jgi:hypothetical protein
MGSSYSSDLRNGRMPEWESRLRQALALIESVANDFGDLIGDTGQFDDAAEDGGTRDTLRRAADEIRSLVPLTDKERDEKIARLERQLAILYRA